MTHQDALDLIQAIDNLRMGMLGLGLMILGAAFIRSFK